MNLINNRPLPTVTAALCIVLPLVSSCSDDVEDRTFDNAEELRSAIEEEGHDCQAFDSQGSGQTGEVIICTEGHTLTVWDAEFEDDDESSSSDDNDTENSEGQNNLRGENWNVMSDDEELLDDLEQSFGGERTSELPPTSDT